MCFSSSIPGYKYLDPLIYRLRCARKLWNRERERTSGTPWDVKSVFPVFPLISCKQTRPLYFFLFLFLFSAGYAQKCCWSCRGSLPRTHNLHVGRSGGRKHACIKDLPENGCNSWWPAFPRFFLIFVFLSSLVTL